MDFKKGVFFKCCAVGENLPVESLPEIIFVGRSNVGKSSVINSLLGRKKLAKISSKPGKTATINFYRAGEGFLVDLPGYGFSKVAENEKNRWRGLIDFYFTSLRPIKLAILVVDCRRDFSNLDLKMINFLITKKLKFIVLLSKVDKLSNDQFERKFQCFKNDFSSLKFLKFSSKTKFGLNELKKVILKFVEK